MNAIKNCYWRWSWEYLWFRHEWKMISEKTKLDWPVKGSHIGERRCVHCGLHQKISNCLGIMFLDEETGGK